MRSEGGVDACFHAPWFVWECYYSEGVRGGMLEGAEPNVLEESQTG